MRVLVTGGHGFLGSHLVDALRARGDAVRCLVRGDRLPASFEGKEVEVVRGDVRDPRAARAAVEGVDEVFHLAALTRSLTRREMMAVNAGGTRALIDAAVERGLPGRFLLCSSQAVVGPTREREVLDEAAPARPTTWYGESKAEAERIVLGAGDRLAVTVARPSAVYGPHDRDFLALFRAAARGVIPVPQLAPRSISLVYGPEVADGMLRLARSPAARGRTYFLAHADPVDAASLPEWTARAVGGASRRFRLPAGATRLAASLSHLAAQWTGKAPLLNRERLKDMAGPYWLCSPAAAERDAGWRAAVGVEEGFRRTAAWYRERGLLR